MELALILPLFIALVFGIIEFGHAWYIYHAVTNASREGARHGVRYRINPAGLRVAPNGFNPSIEDFVKDYLKQAGGFDAEYVDNHVDVVLGGPAAGYASTFPDSVDATGMELIVTVRAPKSWFILGPLIGLSDLVIEADTKMNIE